MDCIGIRSTLNVGRGKPGWGKESTKPPWWPKHVPWQNVRMDARQ